MSSVKNFAFDDALVRVIDRDGDPWFVAKDVAGILGYSKPRNAVSAHCKGALKWGVPTQGGDQEIIIIPERDVYRLIMRSRLPAAERFEEWVVGEVLPSIRRTGSYDFGEGSLVSADGAPPNWSEYWLSVVREARLTYGRAAAARLWAVSPLPQVASVAPDLNEVDILCRSFVEDSCLVTGKSSDFVRSRSLITAMRRYCEASGADWPGDRAASLALYRLAKSYTDPESGFMFYPRKRSNKGFCGIVFVPGVSGS